MWDWGSIGSTGEGDPDSTAVGNRSDLPMGTFGRFRGTFVLLAGESYP